MKTPPLRARRSSAAFTLVELLTVIAIIGILAAIIIPVVGHVRDSARRSQCTSNLRQIGVAFQLYAQDNKNFYPAPRKSDTVPLPATANPGGGNWQMELSPYVLRQQTATEFKNAEANTNVGHCPSYDILLGSAAKIIGTGGYGMNFNINTGDNPRLANDVRIRRASIVRPSRSVLVGDSSEYYINVAVGSGWLPVTDPNKPDGYQSGAPKRHAGSANYLFCDGHVEFLAPTPALAISSFTQ